MISVPGHIRIDGLDIRDYKLDELRDRLAIVLAGCVSVFRKCVGKYFPAQS